MEYFAFGETFLEEHSNTDRTPYLFNGKELDEETGLYYYGARYYDAKTSVWQSVDPLAEKFPSRSPYEYTFSNPINFIDPTGMEPQDPGDGCNCYGHRVRRKGRKLFRKVVSFFSDPNSRINFYSKDGTNKNQDKGSNKNQSINADDIINSAKSGLIRHSKGSAELDKLAKGAKTMLKKIKDILTAFKNGFKDAKKTNSITEKSTMTSSNTDEVSTTQTNNTTRLSIAPVNAELSSGSTNGVTSSVSYGVTNKKDTIVQNKDVKKVHKLSKERTLNALNNR